jgi:hypothetical protein
MMRLTAYRRRLSSLTLLIVLADTAGSETLPAQHRENICWLGTELAAEIRVAAKQIG